MSASSLILIDKDDVNHSFGFIIPECGSFSAQAETNIGNPDVPADYYNDLVDAIYNLFGESAAFGTVMSDWIGDVADPTLYSNLETAEFRNKQGAYRNWIGTLNTNMGIVLTFDSFSLLSGTYWRLKGSDPDTCWYVTFSKNNSDRYQYQIYDHSLVLQTTVVFDIDITIQTPSSRVIYFPILKSYYDLVHAQSFSDSHNYEGCYYTQLKRAEEGSGLHLYSYRVWDTGTYYGWMWYLFNNGGGDEPEPPEPESDDPYNPNYPPGGEDPGSGDRPPYDEGDDIPIPDLPPFNLSDSGFTSLWIPSRTTLGLLASYLWSDNVVQTLIKNLYANPIDVIISLGIVPFNVTPDGTAEICVGTHGTGITSAYVDDDCVIIDCGEVSISEMKPGGYLNFSPYTEAKLFLPFVGFVDIDIDVAMNSELHVEYHVCLTNGSFVAFIESTNQNTHKVIAEFEGNCKITVPITAADYSSMWQAVLGTLTAPLLAAAGGAATGAISGQFIGASAALTSDFAAEGANQGLANSIGQGIGDAGNHITDKLSPNISCSGGFSAGSGMMGNRKPFIVLKSPEVKQPENYNVYRGYPLQAEKTLNTLEGYTEVSNIQLKLPEASGTETGEAERLLRNGFIIGTASHPATQNDGITLCKNNSPINQIGKNVSLISQLNGDFRDSVNMMHPVVRIEKADPTDFNYVYIGEFKRWYFVNKIEVVRTGILDIHLKEDVLESFADDILAHKAIVANNAKAYNVYLNDKQLITTQRSLYWRKEFPSGFFENDGYEWVMLIAGRRQTS